MQCSLKWTFISLACREPQGVIFQIKYGCIYLHDEYFINSLAGLYTKAFYNIMSHQVETSVVNKTTPFMLVIYHALVE